MLYVFIVSSGSIMKFDMNLAVKKVRELKAEIERSLQIPIEDQVLLCSGGEELQEENIVGNYFGAGTDTNPIFLFRKFTNDCEYSYNVPLQTSIDSSIEDDVRGCANMTPSTSTATVRVALAQRFADAAAKGRRECDELVHAQHLQQQGWAAVIANLEDGKDTLIKRKLHCEEVFQKYLAKRSHYQEIIQIFPQDIELLAKIPLLPKLLCNNELLDEALETEHTLLSWFCTEPRSFLDALVEHCQRSLEELNEHCLSALNEDVANVLKNVDNLDIKEVKGIEERLSLLNKQVEDAKKLEKDQRDLAAWFSSTQSRISRDPGVLPDLCGTFQKQLQLMLDNHKCLRDILERCTKAKLELSESINYRIKYISRVENEMFSLQYRINFLEKYVQSVSSRIENFHQVHLAPTRYLQLLSEVCRRKVFSSSFTKWASELSSQTLKLYQKELTIRQSFEGEETRNMVDNLFPGMNDLPPPFAIECPKPFDENLPNILREDLDMLKIRLPELAHFCEVLPPDPMPYISQAESDSAFSSNVPSSRNVVESVENSAGKSQPEKGPTSPQRLAAPSGDYSSLPSEYASMPNEVFSLTSSPFEDPLLPNNQLESALKHPRLLSSATSVEKATSQVESDGEEFETVDGCEPSVDVQSSLSDRKRLASAPRPVSASEVMTIHRTEKGPKVAKAQSEGDAISPIQERLKSSDSLLVSTDFQSTEYYIDDSMPSSYTESNATSPLLRGNRMVKSHHVVITELQKQVELKNGALAGATSSLENSRTHVLKLHAKLSALQKFIQELQGSLHADLSNLKTFVKEEFWERMAEVSQIVENVNKTMLEIQKQTVAEKEEALNKVKLEAENVKTTYLNQLEIQCQKLNDAESQISNYEDYIRQILSNQEEIKQENTSLECELSSKKDVIKSMMLEHELELDSLRNQMRQDMQAKDEEIIKLKQNLSEKETSVQSLTAQKDSLEEELKKIILEKEAASSSLEQKEADFSERLKDLKQLQEEIRRLQEDKDSSKANSKYEEKIQSLQLQLEEAKQKMSTLSLERNQELKSLEEKLTSQHRSEMESLRSRYKLAVSTTTIEKTPSESSPKTEAEEDVQKMVAEQRELWEAEKEKCLQALLEEQQKRCSEAVSEAIQKENANKKQALSNMRRECEENIEKSKSRLVAELQVSFNEAINSVTKEKDSVIENLRSRVAALEGVLLSVKVHIDKYSESKGEAALSQSDSGASTSCKVFQRDEESLVQNLRNEIDLLLLSADQGLPGSSLEEESRSEPPKKSKLPPRKTNPCIECTYKISLLSCDLGDLVLLCYEEKYDSFVAFHLGQFIHFLHPDSLQPLGLKIPAGPTEKWTLGVIANKEFCVARKPSNRYKMNVGTKFFRLKVMPWDKEKAIEEFHFHRSQSRTAAPSPSVSEEGAKGMSASSI